MTNNKIFPYKLDPSTDLNGVECVTCKNATVVHIPQLDKLVNEELKHPAKINGFIVILCTRGSVTLDVQMNEYTIHTNEVFVAPSSVVAFKECHDCEIYIFGFTNEFAIEMNIDLMMIMPLTSSLHSQCVIHRIGEQDIEKIHSSFASQHHEYTTTYQSNNPNTEVFREYIIRHMFASMIYRVCQMVAQHNAVAIEPNSPKDRSSDYFKRLIGLLHTYYKTERSVEFYADKMNLTPKHLSRVVRNHSGKSAHQWIDEFVVLEIKNLLKFSDLSIQQISYELNFPNPSFMGQYFKRITGKTPGAYRKEM